MRKVAIVRQLISSEPSEHCGRPSQRLLLSRHNPSLHRNIPAGHSLTHPDSSDPSAQWITLSHLSISAMHSPLAHFHSAGEQTPQPRSSLPSRQSKILSHLRRSRMHCPSSQRISLLGSHSLRLSVAPPGHGWPERTYTDKHIASY